MFDFHLRDIGAEVAQPGRALDSTLFVFEGEAEDRVVAGSNPALGTLKPNLSLFCGNRLIRPFYLLIFESKYNLKSVDHLLT